MKPIIGITCNYMSQIPDAVAEGIAAPDQDWQLLAQDYVLAVQKAGGVPLILPASEDSQTIRQLAELCDGILISGGNDILPSLYGEQLQSCGKVFPWRDAFDLELTKITLFETKKPLLGICRGCQIFNVALGGTLYQDLPSESFLPHTIVSLPRNFASHFVNIKEGSLLHHTTEITRLGVNSYHHQAIRNLAPGAIAAAVSDDGVTEAIELPGEQFFLGVQWHPEMMQDSDVQQSLFSAFIAACDK